MRTTIWNDRREKCEINNFVLVTLSPSAFTIFVRYLCEAIPILYSISLDEFFTFFSFSIALVTNRTNTENRWFFRNKTLLFQSFDHRKINVILHLQVLFCSYIQLQRLLYRLRFLFLNMCVRVSTEPRWRWQRRHSNDNRARHNNNVIWLRGAQPDENEKFQIQYDSQ